MCWKQRIHPGWTLGWTMLSELMRSSWESHNDSQPPCSAHTHYITLLFNALLYDHGNCSSEFIKDLLSLCLYSCAPQGLTVPLLSCLRSDILNGSAVCVYRMEDVVRAFKGNFLHKEGPQYKWAEFTGKVPYPRPGTVSYSFRLPHMFNLVLFALLLSFFFS